MGTESMRHDEKLAGPTRAEYCREYIPAVKFTNSSSVDHTPFKPWWDSPLN